MALGWVHTCDTTGDREQHRRPIFTAFVLVVACPDCNAEAGYDIPNGYKQELCVFHWFAARRAAFGAVLDDAADAATREVAN